MFQTRIGRGLTFFFLFTACGRAQVITTVAGGGWRPFPAGNLPAIFAPLVSPYSPVLDSQGNLYVADSYNNIVVQISPAGTLTLVAGNGKAGFSGDGGPATSASLNSPMGVAVDSAGNLYIADFYNNRVRKVSGGTITTVAGDGVARFSGDGSAASVSLNQPEGVAVDGAGNLYIADTFNDRIREVSGGMITTVAGTSPNLCRTEGNGPAVSVCLALPAGVAVDSAGSLYIADTYNHFIRKVSGGNSTILVGNGKPGFLGDGAGALNAELNYPSGVALDTAGNLYIADQNNNRIRKLAGGTITTVAGNGQSAFLGDGGSATAGSLDDPTGLAVDSKGQLFIGDFLNARIRKVSGGLITTFAGQGGSSLLGDGGAATSAGLFTPSAAVFDRAGNLYIADTNNNCIRRVSSGVITTVAGNGVAGFSGDGGPATSASLSAPQALAVDAAGNLYIADTNNNRVRKVSGGMITTAATGPAGSASLSAPQGLAVDAAGNLYIADSGNNRILKLAGSNLTTFAGNGVAGQSGNGGSAASASLNYPTGIALDAAGNLYIADSGNYWIRKVSNGTISLVAGTKQGFSGDGVGSPLSAMFDFLPPTGIALDGAGNLYVADTYNNRIRIVSGGTVSTVAGDSLLPNFSGDGGLAINASLDNPHGVAVDGSGNVHIVDTFNNRIREVLAILPTYQISTMSLSFSTISGGTPPIAQQIVLSTGVPGLAFTTATSAPWISVTPSSGSMPAYLQVNVDPTLAPATAPYQATITISAPNSSTPPTTVAVSFTVQSPNPPLLSVGAPRLSFGTLQNGAVQTGQLQISNAGSGSLAYSATSSTTPWLSISPASGTATPTMPGSLTVTADPGSMSPGTYLGSITITGAGSTITVPVSFSITAQNPLISLSATGINFNVVEQGGFPLPQTFDILNSGTGSLTWSAAATPLSGGNWIHISPTSGTVTRFNLDASKVTVSIDPTGLTAGDYYARIQVTAAASNSPQLLTVILSVLPAGTPLAPEVSPASLVFTGTAGSTPQYQDIIIGNPTAQPNSYVSSSIGKGFSYLAPGGDVLPNQPITLRVFPDLSNFQPGEVEQGTITLKFAVGPPRVVNVLNIAAPSPSPSSQLAPQSGPTCPGPLTVNWLSPPPQENFQAEIGKPTTVQVSAVDHCGSPVLPGNGGTVAVNFSNNDPVLYLQYVTGSASTWTGTWKPVNFTPGSLPASVSMSVLADNTNGIKSVYLDGTLLSSGAPLVTNGGVVHAASLNAGGPITPGSLITIKGLNLATGVNQVNQPLPDSLSGATVFLGLTMLPILYTNTGQLNVQVPFGIPVNLSGYQLSVQLNTQTNVLYSMPEPLVIAQANPGVFTLTQDGLGQGVIYRANGVDIAQPGNAAIAGETVTILCTGLGTVTPPVADGVLAPVSPSSATDNPVSVTIGGAAATVVFSGLAPGNALGANPGVYQVMAVVPDGISDDYAQVVVTSAGLSSPTTVTMAVGPATQ